MEISRRWATLNDTAVQETNLIKLVLAETTYRNQLHSSVICCCCGFSVGSTRLQACEEEQEDLQRPSCCRWITKAGTWTIFLVVISSTVQQAWSLIRSRASFSTPWRTRAAAAAQELRDYNPLLTWRLIWSPATQAITLVIRQCRSLMRDQWGWDQQTQLAVEVTRSQSSYMSTPRNVIMCRNCRRPKQQLQQQQHDTLVAAAHKNKNKELKKLKKLCPKQEWRRRSCSRRQLLQSLETQSEGTFCYQYLYCYHLRTDHLRAYDLQNLAGFREDFRDTWRPHETGLRVLEWKAGIKNLPRECFDS